MEEKIKVYINLKYDENSIWKYQNNQLSYETEHETKFLDVSQGITVKNLPKLFDSFNRTIHSDLIEKIVDNFLNKKDTTVFAYGQTGSGKTFTLSGKDIADSKQVGIVETTIEKLFDSFDSLSISIFEIYNERVYDVSNVRKEIKMFTKSDGYAYLKNIETRKCKSISETREFYKNALINRRTSSTEFNLNSSRSHLVVQIKNDSNLINFIDLAGSEKATTEAERKCEGRYINTSLLALGNVVNSYVKKEKPKFRDSKLTRILQESFESGANIIALCMINPLKHHISDSVSTINFAARLANINVIKKTEENTYDLEFIIDEYKCSEMMIACFEDYENTISYYRNYIKKLKNHINKV
ncbi:KIP2 [Hepatospora eriocheir]|uniref:KIP2 n=1 Tax=Hepatospora eriocheir TaxID=1081669 RepID=A0A1X0QBG2_9MICR|nr:KIP2 [Hepatospora eriocheir]